MAKDRFVHLHTHSEYSLLDGASRIEDLVKRTKELGMEALALTDHGNLYAAIKFYTKAKELGIKPIIGCEIYVAPRSRFDKSTKEDRSPHHLILLAKDKVGYRNLIKMVSIAHLEGFYARPRIDKEILEKYHRGIIVLTGCHVGEIPALILAKEYEKTKKVAGWFKEIFKEDFYLELQDQGMPEQKIINEGLIQVSKDLGIKLVATNDIHYTKKEEARAQDIMLCIQTGKFIDEEDRMKFEPEEFYLKSGAQMEKIFPGQPEALRHTLEISEKCNLNLKLEELHLPEFPVPKGETADSYLEKLVWQGVKEKYGKTEKKIEERVKYELTVIEKMGYAPYFLIVSDFINFAKSQKIQVGPGRGSAAGSIVSYALGITNINPLSYDLIFERFLNPERITLPDIDIDFCFERRGEVIDYVSKKYGSDHVAQIVTFGTMAARAAIRDVGRVLRIPLSEVDRVAKLVPAAPDMTIDLALETNKEFKTLYEGDAKVKELIDTAKALEGLTRHASVHAAGVVISAEPLTEYVPLQKMNETQIVTQYSMEDLEKIGLLKMDFLGLRNLTLIAHAIDLIRGSRGIEIDLNSIPLDDSKTYKVLSSGEAVGVFQLESRGMRGLLKELKPERFEDIVALLALYRPGPLESGMVDDFIKRKNEIIEAKYELPELEPILRETHGVILYQEQVMKIASEIAGYSLGEADVLRAAMSKKKTKEMEAEKERFVAGAVKRGIPERKAIHLFNLCAKFAGYGFNKSHSTSYSVISYQTAYLKANFPLEFMAALLTSVMGVTDKVAAYIAECQRLGIKVLPPDINESLTSFTVVRGAIRFGLAAVKNVGVGAVEEILQARSKGEFKSLTEFCRRVDLRTVNKRVIESLIKCGAFDSLGHPRAQLLKNLDKTLDKAQLEIRERSAGQTLLFELPLGKLALPSEEMEEVVEFLPEELLKMEKDMLGLYISDHPLAHLREVLESQISSPISELPDAQEGMRVKIGGILSRLRRLTTRKQELMLVGNLEDLSGGIPIVVFPKAYERYSPYLVNDAVVVVKGKIDLRNDELKVVVEEIEPLVELTKEVEEIERA